MKKIKYLQILMALTWCLNSYANISLLSREFLAENSDIVKGRLEVDLIKYNLKGFSEKRPWSLLYGGSLTDSALDSSSSVSNSNATTTLHTLSLVKEFTWGGEFSFENSYLKIDNDPTSSSVIFGGNQKNYQFSQTVSYSQNLGKNFLGRQEYKEKEVLEKGIELAKASFDMKAEKGLSDFIGTYLNASLTKKMVDLQNQALIRAKKRTELIRKMVKDGLRLKVDLLQARMALIAQREAVVSAIESNKEALGRLANLLHRKISDSEVEVIQENLVKLHKRKERVQGNHGLNVLDKNRVQVMKSLEQMDMGIIPEVTLGAKYKTNEYDTSSGTAFSDGNLTGDKNEFQISLNAVWPIGFGPNKVLMAQKRIEMRMVELEKEKLTKSLEENEIILTSRIDLLNNNISKAKNRVDLALRVLKSYNKLYNLGKKDLDQVIRSEEDLIRTETTLASYIAKKENLVTRLNSLYGSLRQEFMPSSKD